MNCVISTSKFTETELMLNKIKSTEINGFKDCRSETKINQ